MNRIAMDANTLSQLNDYASYAAEFYTSNQHQVNSGCDDCGADLTNHETPIASAVKGEVYRTQDPQGNYVEIRLCTKCAQVIDEPYLQQLIDKRTASPDA